MDTAACLKRLMDAIWHNEHTEGTQAAADLLCALLAGMPVPDCTPRDRDRIATFLAECTDRVD